MRAPQAPRLGSLCYLPCLHLCRDPAAPALPALHRNHASFLYTERCFHVLCHRLLPTTVEAEGTEDGQEEGEVATFSTSSNRSMVKQLIQSIFVQKPTLVLNFAAAALQKDDAELQEGARQLLATFLLQQRQPGEPQQLLLLGVGMTPAEAGSALAAPIEAADEELLASIRLPVGRGGSGPLHQHADPAAAAAGVPPQLGCHVSRAAEVVQSHKGLQQWVSEHLSTGNHAVEVGHASSAMC